ncbi:hypothetical protein F1188_05445 [Roseospira marina]|uniref:Uncharacterized protein n=1 Tax=Roseospira marina TaxID=140057 RepID=A0A5M6IET1_9PROT|nr:hypothetical protein [Roseospira marina]KAA5606774.1 hypothetical protein F1188_05445 [Roseospira marina]MBB4313804.1 hypothetical protein [Roseospira marina]MBB5086966.1 hypothetical protein [Roseospira marina]
MAGDIETVSVHDWLALMKAVAKGPPEAQAALARVMLRHGVDPAGLARRAAVASTPVRSAFGRRALGDVGAAAPPPVAPTVPTDGVEVVTRAPESRSSASDALRDALPDHPADPPTGSPSDAHETAASRGDGPAAGAAPQDDGAGDEPERLGPVRGEELDFDALTRDDDDARWELVGPMVDLVAAARMAGLDANAVRLTLDDVDPEATIVHPSPFCPDPVVFLGVLAVLARTTPHVRLYRVRRRGDGPASILVRVFPHPEEETLALLDAFHPDVADRVRDASLMVADALAHLDGQTRAHDRAGLNADGPNGDAAAWPEAGPMGPAGHDDDMLDFGPGGGPSRARP